MPFRRQQRRHREIARHGIPGRQLVVDRAGVLRGPGDGGEAHRRIHRVVHLGAAVAATREVHHDQVFALLFELRVVEPTPRGEVGDEHPRVLAGRADQRRQDLLAARRAQVHRQRALGLVEAGPEQAATVVRDGPARVVEPPADGVEADHVRAELCQGEPGQGHGHEGRALHHAHSVENSLRHLPPRSRRCRPLRPSGR